MGATRQKAEDALKKADNASTQAVAAHGLVEIVKSSISDVRVEIAREYASQKALIACEERMTKSVDVMSTELRGLNERIDKFMAGLFNRNN